MSVHVSTWAWRQDVGSDFGAKLVLVKLADPANDAGVAYPFQRTLAADCSMSLATLKRKLKLLHDLGLVTSEQSSERSSLTYRLGAAQVAQSEPPLAQADPRGVAQVEPGGSSLLSHKGTVTETDPSTEVSGSQRRDPIWDKLADLFGNVVPAAKNAHGKRNRAVADLRALGATPASIDAALAAWPSLFKDATVTDSALATHYPQLAEKTTRRPRPACSDCGVSPPMHAADCPKAVAA